LCYVFGYGFFYIFGYGFVVIFISVLVGGFIYATELLFGITVVVFLPGKSVLIVTWPTLLYDL
jgi:hypothetical protein